MTTREHIPPGRRQPYGRQMPASYSDLPRPGSPPIILLIAGQSRLVAGGYDILGTRAAAGGEGGRGVRQRRNTTSFRGPIGSRATEPPLPSVPDHELLRCIGRGAYGAVWLARNVMGTLRAVKIVHREDFARDRPFTREYEGLLNYEPISRSHPNLMQILHVGRRDSYFYYVTELADDAGEVKRKRQRTECRRRRSSQ